MNSVKLPDIKLIHRKLAFPYTNSERSKREVKEAVLFTIASKIMKYLGIYHLKRQKTCTPKAVRQ